MRNRDLVLDWLARIRVAGVEAVAEAIGISERRVRGHAERLEAEGLLMRHRMDDGGGAVLVVTARGVRAAGYAANSRSTTSSTPGLLHGRGVSWIAAHCDRCGRPWLGPGELRAEGWPMPVPPRPHSSRESHMPDLAFVLDGEERWAVEFERTPKGHGPLEQILEGYREAQLDVFDEFEIEPEVFFERGEHVAVTVRQRAHGEASGVEVEIRIGHLWTVRDGEIVRLEVFAARDDARKAALASG